ncbi:hypothetical protein JAAARDRAFT_41128, partial [Jaapia argillacea MUCL 33604]
MLGSIWAYPTLLIVNPAIDDRRCHASRVLDVTKATGSRLVPDANSSASWSSALWLSSPGGRQGKASFMPPPVYEPSLPPSPSP